MYATLIAWLPFVYPGLVPLALSASLAAPPTAAAASSAATGTDISLPLVALLGLLQGLTEFLPISSSGHLVIAQALFRMPQPGIALEVILHAGTLVAVIVTFARDLLALVRDTLVALWRWPREGPAALRAARPAGLLILATLPVVAGGLLLGGSVERAFERPRAAAAMLVGTGVLLLSTRLVRGAGRAVGWRVALTMGVAQVISLLPGVSRSGATISGGLLARGRAAEVVRFSFLMSVPAILGSVLIHLGDLARLPGQGLLVAYVVGFLVAMLSGLVAIQLLLRVIAQGRFHLFGIYCLVMGGIGWWVLGRM